MRIAFITNPDGWEGPIYSEALRRARHRVLGVLIPLSPRPILSRLGRRRRPAQRLLPAIERRMLLSAWAARTSRFLRDYSALRAYCRQHRITLLYVWSLASARSTRLLTRLKPDILFSASLSHLVPRALIRIPRLAAVNIHGGLLPDYGGLGSAYWVLHEGEKRAGITFHTLEERFDSGRIILRRSLKIQGRPTPEDLAERLIRLAAASLPACVNRIRAGKFETAGPVRSRLRPSPVSVVR